MRKREKDNNGITKLWFLISKYTPPPGYYIITLINTVQAIWDSKGRDLLSQQRNTSVGFDST